MFPVVKSNRLTGYWLNLAWSELFSYMLHGKFKWLSINIYLTPTKCWGRPRVWEILDPTMIKNLGTSECNTTKTLERKTRREL